MSLYVVTEKATGAEIYRYQSDAPIEWNGMEFLTHEHTLAVEVASDGSLVGSASRVLTKKDFLKRFTPEEYGAIKAATLANSTVDYYWQLFVLADDIVTGDPDTISGINLLEQVGLLAQGRAREILNG